MTIWLASYPRSGNTLLRIVLKRCFGLLSQSIYEDREFEGTAVGSVVGHEPVDTDLHNFLQRARLQRQRLYVKTHELPGSDRHPAIYVLRDGRSSLVSYHHYLRDVMGSDVTLADVIRGRIGPSWSEHVMAWALSKRENTLVVRYEDLREGKAATLHAISAFLAVPLIREFDVVFTQLQLLNSQFFRSGSDHANIAEMDLSAVRLFEQLHGDTLRRLGYG